MQIVYSIIKDRRINGFFVDGILGYREYPYCNKKDAISLYREEYFENVNNDDDEVENEY